MPNQNSVFLTGHCGRDAELRFTPDGTAVLELSMAVTDKITGRDGNSKEETVWVRVEAWAGWASGMKGTLKGDVVQVVGKLKQREWQDSKGAKQTRTYVRATAIFNHSRTTGRGPDSSRAPADETSVSVPVPSAEEPEPENPW